MTRLSVRGSGRVVLGFTGSLVLMLSGCRGGDPARAFIAQQESLPPAERVPDFERLKTRMSRTAPRVGQAAPDFTLPVAEGNGQLTRSKFHPDRPLVLVFGSFT